MNRNIILGGVFCTVLAMFTAIPAFAEWTPSKTQQEIISTSGSLIKEEPITQNTNESSNENSNSTDKDKNNPTNDRVITSVVVTTGDFVPEGIPVTSTGHAILSKIKEPMIKITPLSVTQSANEEVDDGLSFHDKKWLETESGLTYSDNEKTNLVHKTMVLAQNTSEFLSKFTGDAHSVMQEIIFQKLEREKLELYAKREEAEQNNDIETLLQIDSQLATIEQDHYTHVDNYAPFAVFDVAVTDALREQMGNNGKVSVTFELNGVKQDSDMIALHFRGDIEDTDIVHQALEEDFENSILEFDVEVLDVVVDHGVATIELSSFSPIMFMMRAEAVEENEPIVEESLEIEDEISHTISSELEDGQTIWGLNIAIAAVVVILLIMYKKRKS